ncbi:uncharacterized protein LOC118415777 [Branchiostoma floridae]|uniref:Uncharacterized protein LOC118415777 n=2 Tax=Branchiostoma floridae TaxID=7739 RepID=A0A9J7MQ33_BRAFL|nr:uncharacterized protein LOC118415777 [Branchiostoma floridae]XP_035676487.1 uncharacterized protein LOC118415777 [Branchiostoma floridae]
MWLSPRRWPGVCAVLLTLLPVLHVYGQTADVCPTTCVCQAEGVVSCVGRQLEGVPTNIPPDTRTLDLGNTGISRIPGLAFSQVPGLEVLRMEDNKLESDTVAMFGFVGIQKLQGLFLSGNRLTHSFLLRQSYYIPRSLRNLDLSRNPLLDVRERTFYFLQNLERLYLSHCELNFLRSEAFVGLFSLHDLHLEDNLFTQVPSAAFKNVPNLRRLFLNGNPVHSISATDFTELPKLQLLDMRMANVSRIDEATFNKTPLLQTLLLSGNTNLFSVDKNIFANLTELTHLELADCAFQSAGTYILTSLKSLTTLTIHGNPFACGPSMCGFRTWLDTTDVNVLQKYGIRCASPGYLQNVPVLNASIAYLCKGERLSQYYTSLAQAAIEKCPYNCFCNTTMVQCPEANLGKMPTSFPPQINKLVMRGNALTTLKIQALERVRYVTWLDLSANNLTSNSFDEGRLAMLPFLKHLNLSRNMLSSYTLAEQMPPSTKLEELDMSNNPLGNIRAGNFRLLGLLRKLHLNSVGMTELTSFSFMGLFSVQELHLANNNLNALPIKGFRFVGMVKKLVLRGNPITQLTDGSFLGMPQLTYLDMRNSRLLNVQHNTFKYTPYLTELLLGGNKNLSYISSMTFSTMPNVQVIDLSGCSFRSLPNDTLPRLPRLRAASLHNNPWHCDGGLCWLKKMALHRAVYIPHLHQLTCVTPRYVAGDTIRDVENQFICPRESQVPVVITNLIEDSIFIPQISQVSDENVCPEQCQCYKIEKRVDCSHANLRSVPSPVPPDTVHLNLANNYIKNISDTDFANLENLQRLDLQNNLISNQGISKGALKGLDNVRILHLSDNKLSEIPLQLSRLAYSLRMLDLSGNTIQALEPGTFKSFRTLRDLVLSDVGLNTIKRNAFDGLKKLLRLSLAYNNLTTIPEELGRLPNLAELYVRGNSIRTLQQTSLRGLTGLEFLDLSDLGLRVLEPGAFENLAVLDTLVLSDNSGIYNLDTDVFRGLQSLRTLRMTDCGLRTVDRRLLSDMPALTSVVLHGNPLECSADLCSLIRWLHDKEITIENHGEVRCTQWSQTSTAVYVIEDAGFQSFCENACGECTGMSTPMPTTRSESTYATATLLPSTGSSDEVSDVTTPSRVMWLPTTRTPQVSSGTATPTRVSKDARTTDYPTTVHMETTPVPKPPLGATTEHRDKNTKKLPLHPNIDKIGSSVEKYHLPSAKEKNSSDKPQKSASCKNCVPLTTVSARIPFLATGRGVDKGRESENKPLTEKVFLASVSGNIEPSPPRPIEPAEMVNNSNNRPFFSNEGFAVEGDKMVRQRSDSSKNPIVHTTAPTRPATHPSRGTQGKYGDVPDSYAKSGQPIVTPAVGPGSKGKSPDRTMSSQEESSGVIPANHSSSKASNKVIINASSEGGQKVPQVVTPDERTKKKQILFSDVEGNLYNNRDNSNIGSQQHKTPPRDSSKPPIITQRTSTVAQAIPSIPTTTRKEGKSFLHLPTSAHIVTAPFSPIVSSSCPAGCGCYEEMVRCSGVTKVPRLSHPRLEVYLLSNNRISRIPQNVFSWVSSMRRLYLDNCDLVDDGITEESFSSLSHLKYLHLSQNRLRSVPTTLPTSLEYLYLDGNEISAVGENTFVGLPNLRSLYLQGNNLTSESLHPAAFTSLANLTSLYLSGNKMGKLDVIFPPSLEVLRLGNNSLSTISPETFLYLPHLQKLVLSDNTLETVPRGLFSGLLSLQYLHLDNNKLVTVPADLPKGLIHLNVADNAISAIPASIFFRLQMLVALNLSNNNLYDDRIEDLDFGYFKHLQQLQLSGNHLTSVPRNLPKSLRYLDLQANLLSEKTANVENLKGSVGLKYLSLAENYFREVPMPLPPSLESLHLNNNLIIKISPKVFSQTPRLKTLNLSRNMLGDGGVVRDSFFGTTNLAYLDLSGNHLNNSLRFLPTRVQYLIL